MAAEQTNKDTATSIKNGFVVLGKKTCSRRQDVQPNYSACTTQLIFPKHSSDQEGSAAPNPAGTGLSWSPRSEAAALPLSRLQNALDLMNLDLMVPAGGEGFEGVQPPSLNSPRCKGPGCMHGILTAFPQEKRRYPQLPGQKPALVTVFPPPSFP